jgi:hypothetical protein
VSSLSGGMCKTGNKRSGSWARQSRRELHERYGTVDRIFSRRTSSEAQKCTESRTICRPDPQEELSPGVRDRLIGDPDPEHGCGSLDREHELESIPCSVQLDARFSVCVSEATKDVNLGDAVYKNNGTLDGEQVDERSAVGTDKSDLGDECIYPLHSEASCNLTNSVGTENYSMLTTVARARSEPRLKWKSILAVLLSCETVNFTVEQYKTLRGTLIWQSSQLGATQETLPGFRKIQRSLVPLMCDFSCAKSKVELFANSSIAQDRLVWFFLSGGLSWTPVPALYTRPCSAVIYMERKALDHISCLTTLRTLQSSFIHGEPSQPLNAFSSMPSRKKNPRMCPEFLWLQRQVIP